MNALAYQGYPIVPPFTPEEHENLDWYYNEKEQWGCWIQNRYKKPMLVPASIDKALKNPFQSGDSPLELSYRSPIPLHNPCVQVRHASHITWVVNEHGWGMFLYYIRTWNEEIGSYQGTFMKMKYNNTAKIN